jgi:hypothetical protein
MVRWYCETCAGASSSARADRLRIRGRLVRQRVHEIQVEIAEAGGVQFLAARRVSSAE